MNKISVFDKLATKDTVVNTNGIVLDSILLTANVEEDLEKDSYILTAEFTTLDNLYKTIMEKSILKVKLDYGYDYFVVKNIDSNIFDKTIEVTARHITEEAMLGLWIDNIAPTNLSGKDAIQWVYDRAIGTKEINFISDITETLSADYVRMNMQEMLYNTTNGLLTKKVTGEVLRRGYTVYIKKKIKFENDLEIRKGKNLTGFTGSEDCSNIVTRVNPISYNAPITNVYVSSPLIDNYKSVITKEIKYDNVRLASDVSETDENRDSYIICQDEDNLRDKLIELATKEFTENEIDKAQCEYDISFEDLSTTEEYKDYAILENVGTGEVVKVIVDTLGYDLNARVIKRKYDVCKQKITSCTLSNVNKAIKPQGFYDITIKNNSLLNSITDDNGDLLAQKLKGYLDSKDVSIRASKLVADKQDYIVAISECLDESSSLYGAIMWGTGGIYLANKRTSDGKDWEWTTGITSSGINAEMLIGDYIMSRNGRTKLDLNTGNWEIELNNDESNKIIITEKGLQRRSNDLSGGGYAYFGYTYGFSSASEIVLNNGESWSTTAYSVSMYRNISHFAVITAVGCTALSNYYLEQKENSDGTTTFTAHCTGSYDGMNYTGWIRFRLISYAHDGY